MSNGPVYFQQRNQYLEVIQVMTSFTFKSAIVGLFSAREYSAIVGQMDIQQPAVILMMQAKIQPIFTDLISFQLLLHMNLQFT